MYSNPVTLHPWKYVYIEHDPLEVGRRRASGQITSN